jgi:hypothetical protein
MEIYYIISIKMSDSIKDKSTLISFIKKKSSEKDSSSEINRLKNIERLNASMGIYCGKECLTNFGDRTITPIENTCLVECARKYYDLVEAGNKNLYSPI